MADFDIVTQMTSEATTLLAVVGGTIAAGLGVWVVAIGARIGVKRFAAFATKG
jgi:hypothetical protein